MILDVEIDAAADAACMSSTSGSAPDLPSTGPGTGFMSHEAPISARISYRTLGAAGSVGQGFGGGVSVAKQRRRIPRVAGQQQGGHERNEKQNGEREGSKDSFRIDDGSKQQHKLHHDDDGHHHHRFHDSFHTRSVTIDSSPLPLKDFQHFVARQLIPCSGGDSMHAETFLFHSWPEIFWE